jgi:hypothetical protein
VTVPTNYRDARRAELRGLDDDALAPRCRSAIEQTYRWPDDVGLGEYRQDCWCAASDSGRAQVFLDALEDVRQRRARERAANAPRQP